jgi:long-chain acyl-CoA synthetase
VGAVVVPIYQTNSPDECRYVLENSDAKAVIVEDDEQLAKIDAIRDRVPKLEHVVRMDGTGGNAISMDELIRAGSGHSDADWEQRWQSVGPDDICTIIYTSGTTGPPKGCVISHGNYRSMITMALDESVLERDSTTFLFLPLAHSFALLIQFLSFDLGGNIAYWERDPLKIIPNLTEVKPDYFPSVPRIFEKIYTSATGEVEKSGGLKKLVFNWAIGVGRKVRQKERAGERVGWLLRRQYELADKQVLSKIRALFGGRIKNCVTGAAPINPEILRFFDAAGVLILEGWGMTETSTAATVARPDAFRFGKVGRAFEGCEIKIADDGEILVRGPNVFQGYYKNDDATRETIDEDGWLHTGDIGEIDKDGYLSITGRKKDIIITAGGKNITPANLEAEIKQSPYVSQCVVIGDRRPYLVALITLDMEECAKLAEEQGWPKDAAALADHEEMRGMIQEHLDKVNEKFARVEQVKKFEILPHDLSQETGELTPTLKVKRNVVADKYEQQVDALYA